MQLDSLRALYIHELNDLHDAESQLIKALPTLAQAAWSEDLRLAFERHLDQTREHVRRLGDLMMRCRIGVGPCQGLRCALRAAQIFAQERGLDPTDERAALMDLLERRWRSARPVLTGQQLAQAELLMLEYTGVWQMPGPRLLG